MPAANAAKATAAIAAVAHRAAAMAASVANAHKRSAEYYETANGGSDPAVFLLQRLTEQRRR
jgi:hypothetical protein